METFREKFVREPSQEVSAEPADTRMPVVVLGVGSIVGHEIVFEFKAHSLPVRFIRRIALIFL